MSEPVVVVTGGEPAGGGGDAGAAFAAGVATATATGAADEAEEATETAEAAQATADLAANVAFDAQVEVGRLRDDMASGFAALHARFDEQTTVIELEEENPLTPPDVEPEKPAETEEEPEKEKPKKTWGSDAWFGDR